MERRRFLQAGAVATAGAWVAPTIESASAQPAPGTPILGGPGDCVGFAYDILVTLTGPAGGRAGPIRETPPNQHAPLDCLIDLDVAIPGGPVIAEDFTSCVGNDFDDRPCDTIARIEQLDTNPDALPVSLSATAIEATASADCAAGPPTGSATLVDAVITIFGNPVALPVNPAPNTTIPLPPGFGVLMLNEQIVTDGPGDDEKIEVNAIHYTLTIPLPIGEPQVIEITVAHAEADVENCP